MAYATSQGRQDLLDGVAEAIDALAAALAALETAYELLDEGSQDRLEAALFKPVQSAYGRAQRTHTTFAERHGMPTRHFDPAPLPSGSPGARALVDRAVDAVGEADLALTSLQDSLLPVEVGDPELRAGLAEVRAHVDHVQERADGVTRQIGR